MDLFENLIGAILYFLVEILIQVVIRFPGYLICKYLVHDGDNSVSPDGAPPIWFGLLFWTLVGLGVFVISRFI